LAPPGKRPDVLIERDGETVALRSETGNLVFPPATAESYSAGNWLRADGDARNIALAAGESTFRCDSLGCIGTVKGKVVALVRHPGALEEDCRRADIVIVPFTVGKKCRAARVIVDRRMLRTHGAHALYIDGLSIRTETVAAARGRRPWVPERDVITPRRLRAQARPLRATTMKTKPNRASTAIRRSERGPCHSREGGNPVTTASRRELTPGVTGLPGEAGQ
jgi:competence protein ComEC